VYEGRGYRELAGSEAADEATVGSIPRPLALVPPTITPDNA